MLMHYQRRTCRVRTLAIMIAATGLLSGCSNDSANDPATSPVTGLVTLDGTPVAGAIVMFRPKTTSGATIVQAKTDAEGKFDAHIYLDMGKRTKRGVMPADYLIEVTQLTRASLKGSVITPPKNLLPKKYASIRTSGLEANVIADGDNELLLELSSR